MRLIRNLLLAGAIVASWLVLVYILWLLNILVLVPWDVSLVRPDVGTWQRTLNDFFEGRVGEIVVLLTVAGATGLPILATLFRRWYVGARIIALNLIITLLLYAQAMFSFTLTNVILPVGQDINDPFSQNYTRSLLPLISIWMCYAVWAWQVRRIGFAQKQKNKAKNTLAVVSTNRLTAQPTLEDAHTEQEDSAVQQRLALRQ